MSRTPPDNPSRRQPPRRRLSGADVIRQRRNPEPRGRGLHQALHVVAAHPRGIGDRRAAPLRPFERPRIAPRPPAKREARQPLQRLRPNVVAIRGAKAHQTGCINSHWVVVMPTMRLRPEDKDYAVVAAIPVEDPGLTFIYGRQSCDTRSMEGGEIDQGNAQYGGQEAMIIIDDVFVPWDRIFMDGETEFAAVATTDQVLSKKGDLTVHHYVDRKSSIRTDSTASLRETWDQFETGGREFWMSMDKLSDTLESTIDEEVADV